MLELYSKSGEGAKPQMLMAHFKVGRYFKTPQGHDWNTSPVHPGHLFNASPKACDWTAFPVFPASPHPPIPLWADLPGKVNIKRVSPINPMNHLHFNACYTHL